MADSDNQTKDTDGINKSKAAMDRFYNEVNKRGFGEKPFVELFTILNRPVTVGELSRIGLSQADANFSIVEYLTALQTNPHADLTRVLEASRSVLGDVFDLMANALAEMPVDNTASDEGTFMAEKDSSTIIDNWRTRAAFPGPKIEAEVEPLHGGGGGGMFGGMEPRIAVLEADMKHVKAQLDKLAGVPSDLATLKERTSHLPTKAEMQKDIEAQLDRSAGRVQRTIGITGGLVTLAVAAINYLPKLIS